MTPAAAWRPAIADLAWVFHWPPGEIKRMPVSELRAYHALAAERAKALFGGAGAR